MCYEQNESKIKIAAERQRDREREGRDKGRGWNVKTHRVYYVFTHPFVRWCAGDAICSIDACIVSSVVREKGECSSHVWRADRNEYYILHTHRLFIRIHRFFKLPISIFESNMWSTSNGLFQLNVLFSFSFLFYFFRIFTQHLIRVQTVWTCLMLMPPFRHPMGFGVLHETKFVAMPLNHVPHVPHNIFMIMMFGPLFIRKSWQATKCALAMNKTKIPFLCVCVNVASIRNGKKRIS